MRSPGRIIDVDSRSDGNIIGIDSRVCAAHSMYRSGVVRSELIVASKRTFYGRCIALCRKKKILCSVSGLDRKCTLVMWKEFRGSIKVSSCARAYTCVSRSGSKKKIHADKMLMMIVLYQLAIVRTFSHTEGKMFSI